MVLADTLSLLVQICFPKEFFIKHLKEFYRSKGSEKSFQTLFRALYAQESLDFYYPKTDLLKVSDGIWAQDTILQLDYDVDYLNFNGLTITGLTSGATAFVSNVTTRKLGTIPLIELVLKNESLKKQTEIKENASKDLEQARSRISTEATKARSELKEMANDLASQIANRLAGRNVA